MPDPTHPHLNATECTFFLTGTVVIALGSEWDLPEFVAECVIGKIIIFTPFEPEESRREGGERRRGKEGIFGLIKRGGTYVYTNF